MKALRRACWGLTAGLVLAGPALAQYGAHIPGQNATAIPRATTITAPQATGAIVTLPPIASTNYYTPDVPKGYVLQPVSHTATIATITGMPAGYVLQSVDGQPITTP